MKVITGSAGGRNLLTPPDDAIRPTADQVKQAVFNVLQFDIEGRRVLDLFAGTGQLGIEALSRGAREAVFVDSSPRSLALVRNNLRLCSLEGTVLRTDALDYLARGEKFDIILVDPPYDAGLYEPVLERINAVDNLNEGGIMVCESRTGRILPDMRPPYRQLRSRKYGSVRITLYTRDVGSSGL